jgi:hypothetical protein
MSPNTTPSAPRVSAATRVGGAARAAPSEGADKSIALLGDGAVRHSLRLPGGLRVLDTSCRGFAFMKPLTDLTYINEAARSPCEFRARRCSRICAAT